MGQYVEKQATICTPQEMEAAIRVNWEKQLGTTPARKSTLLLTAQWDLETGTGRACKNWNIGNVKGFPSKDPGAADWTYFQTWELVSRTQAERDLADPINGRYCKKAGENVDGGKVKMVYFPTHPACCFRSYPSLEAGVEAYLAFLRRRYISCWPYVEAGDVPGFVKAIRAKGYFTAPLKDYIAGMQARFYAAAGAGRFQTKEQVQDALKLLGYSSVQAFQAFSGLTADGITGPQTKGALALALDESQAA